MSTNDDTSEKDNKSEAEKTPSQIEDERTESIKKAKEALVESPKGSGEPASKKDNTSQADEKEEDAAEEGQTDDGTGEESVKDTKPTFTKGEGFDWIKADNPEDYARELEKAYTNSSSEALKWKKQAEEKDDGETPDPGPILRQAQRREQARMEQEYEEFVESYPQMNKADNIEKLQSRVVAISKSIQETENREPSFSECLSIAASTLGWQKDTSEEVGKAVKAEAATSATSSPGKQPAKSKVTKQMIETAKKMRNFDGKSDAEITKELEAHVS